MRRELCLALVAYGIGFGFFTEAQPANVPDGPPGEFGPGGPSPDFFRNGPFPDGPGPMREELKLVAKFDKDGDKRLNAAERKAAREFAVQERSKNRGQRGPRRGPPGMEEQTPPQPGPKMSPNDAKPLSGEPLYTTNAVRTLFLDFENADWEKELSDFNNTDVEVPAKLTVDGKTYDGVGVGFRGASSLMMVGEGRKKSLNLSVDYTIKNQNVLGVRTLNLLNSHEDASFLRTVLYSHIAHDYIPAPRANFVRVVINGEYWGVFVNAEQFNKDFTKHFYGSDKGARWKVPGSPRGGGSLAYLGEDPAPYKRAYEIKSKDEPKSWAALIQLCKTLSQTPSNDLVKALTPLLDIDGALKFLALENALINNDGYWVRTSDYNLYLDERGRFHVVPHDFNETFAKPGGPGFMMRRRIGPGTNAGPEKAEPPPDFRGPPPAFAGPGPGPGMAAPQVNGVELDPLFGSSDTNKPLISKLLAVPELRAKYLGYVRDIAEKWLNWNKLGPIATHYHNLIAADVKLDTRKLDSTENFEKSLTQDTTGRGFGPGGGTKLGLKNFADQRRAFLLKSTPTVRADAR